MAGGTTAVPSNDLSTNLGRKKDFGLRKNTSSQVRGELRLDRADVVIDGLWADLNFHVTEEDIAEARREMWGNFPRDIKL